MNDFCLKLKAYGADVLSALQRLADDEQLYEYCVYELCNDKLFKSLAQALQNYDFEAAYTSVHTLKGVCANLDLTPLFKHTNELCRLLKNDASGNLPFINAEHTALLQQLDRLNSVLNNQVMEDCT